jgi:lipopolysaccharide export system permease protein
MIFDRYLFRQVGGAFVLIALTLSAIIMLTQSLRFLELVINSGASSAAFWVLSFLALPRLFEVIFPLALVMAVVFIYNRMSGDSEVTAMRAAGFSPLRLGRASILLSAGITLFLIVNTIWLAPASLNALHQLRQNIKTEFSTLLLREGVFNQLGDDLTVFVEKRSEGGVLEGLVIHDSRAELPAPVTIMARRGQLVATDTGQQVIVFEGSRQDINQETGALNRLDFSRYSVDFPENSAVSTRWREPEERRFSELLNPDEITLKDPRGAYKFIVEANRRVAGPILAMTLTMMALACLLMGPVDRRGQGLRVLTAACLTIAIQLTYMSVLELANLHVWGIFMMYGVVLVPLILGFLLLRHEEEVIRIWRHLRLRPVKAGTP